MVRPREIGFYQFGGGIIGASLFGMFYFKILKRKPSRILLTIVAFLISILVGFGYELTITNNIFLSLAYSPVFYASLTKKNKFLAECYETKFSKTFKVIMGVVCLWALIILLIVIASR